jgi:hypothetical protein
MVHMTWAGRFEKLLEVIHGLPRLTFKITHDSKTEHLIGVIGVLVVITFVATGDDLLMFLMQLHKHMELSM